MAKSVRGGSGRVAPVSQAVSRGRRAREDFQTQRWILRFCLYFGCRLLEIGPDGPLWC